MSEHIRTRARAKKRIAVILGTRNDSRRVLRRFSRVELGRAYSTKRLFEWHR
jgi:hypothetical protein